MAVKSTILSKRWMYFFTAFFPVKFQASIRNRRHVSMWTLTRSGTAASKLGAFCSRFEIHTREEKIKCQIHFISINFTHAFIRRMSIKIRQLKPIKPVRAQVQGKRMKTTVTRVRVECSNRSYVVRKMTDWKRSFSEKGRRLLILFSWRAYLRPVRVPVRWLSVKEQITGSISRMTWSARG